MNATVRLLLAVGWPFLAFLAVIGLAAISGVGRPRSRRH